MKTYLGEEGLNKTWQEDFPRTTKCYKCKGEARIMFVALENREEKKHICDLHENKGEGDYWFHDCIAIASYLCRKCFEATALVNQA